ncbi:MAG: bifunctional demethylmenaquinone methyltransferase/2-methoxy-6-polyprenyl-1,4-benzoquinol methylase UbiE [Tannerella sp.]|jgi:demethylmenaquinone methyltransferase/2-methoxy-6-polyprenyl-1,4-benzoquinol methylase|nr:bifunctional demethylmenaquinone methyltransferase/2-methoxy-6-polyprenyl-1,4-benzoquinol methylase UbiE [Tannerella sp.]
MAGLEQVLPYGGTERKDIQVRRMFDVIAGRYDRLNHVLSLGIDRWWRRQAVDFLRPYHPARILDIASGTGDLAMLLCRRLKPDRVVGADISREMMAIGARKAGQNGLSSVLSFEYQDCMSLSYPDHSFDAVTAAFGVRNFLQLERGFSEMYRVLKPGGHIVVLELSTPAHFPVKQLYRLYCRVMVSIVGGYLGLEKAAYNYLPASVKAMPQGKEMLELIGKQGFTDTRTKRFTFGVCSLYTGKKNITDK